MEDEAPRSPDRAAIQQLAAVVMKAKVVNIERLDGYLQRTYRLGNGTGESFCLLKCTAAPRMRLLGLEEDRLAVEASVLSLLGRRVEVAAPKLLEYQAAMSAVGGSYIISGPYSGAIMGFMTRPLSESDRIDVDYSLGSYFRRLASMTNPSFGPFRRPNMSSWARYFEALIEPLLGSADEVGIVLPYGKVRELIRRYWNSLDQVLEAKLVLLEVKASRNMVIDEHSKDVTSLVDYSTAIWGDPFISDAFQCPARGFLEGFGDSPSGDIDKRIRKLLYSVFHALLALVRQRYRPHSANLESEAMKTLLTAVRYLDGLVV